MYALEYTKPDAPDQWEEYFTYWTLESAERAFDRLKGHEAVRDVRITFAEQTLRRHTG